MPRYKQYSSFRDPSGFLVWDGDELFRQINMNYKNNYDHLMSSGLYATLVEKGLLISHHELNKHEGFSEDAYKIIQPEIINFISYPYEWAFSQLKDAALTTLKIQKICLDYGMSLKDASAYNIQFLNGKPIFIDTLSFEIYEKGKPWAAYKQFCQHFLAPLALMSFTDIRLNQLLKNYIDGIPLDLAAKLLPGKTLFNISLLMHLHWHAKAQIKYGKGKIKPKSIKIKLSNLYAIIDSLEGVINKIKLKSQVTEWDDYYTQTNYSGEAFAHKKKIVKEYLKYIKPSWLWDLGANNGVFTRIASQEGIDCIAFDVDPLAVEHNYLMMKDSQERNNLPVVIDLTNPSPSIGWNNNERMTIKERGLPDTVMALALIHHMAITNNLPFEKAASFFDEISTNLIIEFVPKSDSQVKKMLISREDIFLDYGQSNFERAFTSYFDILSKEKIKGSERLMYLMKKKL